MIILILDHCFVSVSMPSSQDDTLQAEDDTKLDPLSDLAYQVNLYCMNYVVRVYCPSCTMLKKNVWKTSLEPTIKISRGSMRYTVRQSFVFIA